jgi:hypothetical protein
LTVRSFAFSAGPPRVSFTWRHWGNWTGPYKTNRSKQPTGELVEMFGSATVHVDDALKIEEIHVFFDPSAFLGKLMRKQKDPAPVSSDGRLTECPFVH